MTWRPLALASALFLCSSANSEVLTFFGDAGFPSASGVFAGSSFDNAQFNGRSRSASPVPEGFESWETIAPTDFWWGYQFPTPQNLSRFAGGEFRFWILSDRSDVRLQMKFGPGPVDFLLNTDLGSLPGFVRSQWSLVRVPLSGVNLNSVLVPFVFAGTANGSPVRFWVDHIRYVDNASAVTFSAQARNRFTNSPATQSMSFPVSSLPVAGDWAVANEYIQLTIDMNEMAWGVQVYTDNTASDASPRFVGPSNANPAGLVDTTDRSKTLPLAWSIRGTTDTVVNALDPSDAANWSWSYLKDRLTPAIPPSTTAWVDGDPYATVRNQIGIHWNADPRVPFGADHTPDYVYFQARYREAVTPRSYQTNKLVVELFVP